MWAAVQSLLIGLLALAGVWFGWYLQRCDKSDARAERTLEILRGKAEEIYELLQTCINESKTATFHAIEDANGLAPGGRPVDHLPSLDRLKALVTMYFPSARPIIEELDRKIFPSLTQHAKLIADLIEKEDLEISDKVHRMRNSQLELARITASETVVAMMKLRGFMDGVVPNLI